MKRIGRILLRVVAGLTVLAALGVVVCLEGVDYRPYFRQPYYRETAARLRAELATNSTTRGPVSAGFGRVRLTPSVNAAQDDPRHGQFRALPLAGYGNRNGRSATGVHDDLYVKAAALRVGNRLGVMVGADALIIPREVADSAAAQLQRDLGLRREQLYLSATHTHCSLGGWAQGPVGKAFAGSFQSGARTWFAECIATAVREAVADLKPAWFGQGSLPAPEFVRNRLVGELGKVDPEFSFAVLKQDAGHLCVLGSYAAHATVLSGNIMEFSADYPGYWQRAVEEATGGSAIFLAGEVGSQGPVAGGGGFEGAERMGRALAKKVLDRLAGVSLTNQISFNALGLQVTLPPLQTRLGDGIRLRPWLAARLLPVTGDSFVQVFRLEDCAWISTPCDFSGELGLGIKDTFRSHQERAVITSFNGDYVGYVILPRYYHLDGYEPRTMSFFGPYVPDYLDELIRTMAAAVMSR